MRSPPLRASAHHHHPPHQLLSQSFRAASFIITDIRHRFIFISQTSVFYYAAYFYKEYSSFLLGLRLLYDVCYITDIRQGLLDSPLSSSFAGPPPFMIIIDIFVIPVVAGELNGWNVQW